MIEVMVDFKSTIPTQDEISNVLILIQEALDRSHVDCSSISHDIDSDPWVYDMAARSGDERIYHPSYSLRILITLS